MSVAAFVLSAAVLALPAATTTPDAARSPVRCGPSPYYVADRHAELTQPATGAAKRAPRPCYLVRADGRSSTRIA